MSQAAHLATRIRQRQPVAIDKPDRTRLTMADLTVQALITHALEQACPGESLVAEEDASSIASDVGRGLVPPLLRALEPLLPGVTASNLARLLDRGGAPPTPRSWVLDPIDGTEGFLRSGGHYVVALALLDEGQPRLGLLGCPTVDAGGFPEPRSALCGSLLVA
jgi:3'(2'), 5'-bisphosphate nucleotidase